MLIELDELTMVSSSILTEHLILMVLSCVDKGSPSDAMIINIGSQNPVSELDSNKVTYTPWFAVVSIKVNYNLNNNIFISKSIKIYFKSL